MPRKIVRRLVDAVFGTYWDRLLRRARLRGASRLVIAWNRGLGDIPLGLYQVVAELDRELAGVEITIVTRAELAECMRMLPVAHVAVDPEMRRGEAFNVRQSMRRAGIPEYGHDLVLTDLDPTRWFRGPRRMQPALSWPDDADALAAKFDPALSIAGDDATFIAVHVSSETAGYYRYRKDWPTASWRALFEDLASRRRVCFVLFGLAPDDAFDGLGCVDLRGRTSLLEMLAIIRTRCPILVAPDSGVLTVTYFLDTSVPLDVVSLWSDPRQGVLKHAMASPNPHLRHVVLIGDDEQVERIPVADVSAAIESILTRPAA